MADTFPPKTTFAEAIAHHQAGRLREAEPLYRAVLAALPTHADANHNLGVLAMQLRQPGGALPFLKAALDVDPARPQFWVTYASALAQSDQADAARRAVAQARDTGAGGPGLDTLAEQIDQMAAAATPETAEALHDRGLMPGMDPVAAADLFRRAIALRPDYAVAHASLAAALLRLDQTLAALDSARRATALNPDLAEAHSNEGAALERLGQAYAAEAAFRRAVTLKPSLAGAHNNLGGALRELGRYDEALAAFGRALELAPNNTTAFSNLLFTENCIPGRPIAPMLADARRFGDLVARLARPYSAWNNQGSARGVLRVGLVSPDLRAHPVGYFIEGVAAVLSGSPGVELFAYPSHMQDDAVSERVRAACAAWRPVGRVADEAAAQMIHDDGVDVLIDLAGHTGNNRLPLFAWRPAPVQVSWLGYVATTGVAAIDHVLGDPWKSPPAEDGDFTETVWRLPRTFACFTPPEGGPDVAPLPALALGAITFGCFNNLAKMGEAVVALWARVLKAAPDSRLLLKTKQLADEAARAQVLARFSAHGVEPDRLILEGPAPRADYLAAYGRVDIALDPFPFPGGTTSLEGMWMGVPVVTRVGDRFLSHMGETVAHNAGLADWIAQDDDGYVAIVLAKAADLPALSGLRASMRQRLLTSPLLDAAAFAHDLEEALWGMYRRKAGA